MRKQLEDLGVILFITVAYFTSVTFAVAAWVPLEIAIQAGLVATGAAMIFYLVLVFADRAEGGTPFIFLIGIPVACALAGVLWWILRLLGVWEPLK